MTPEPVWTFWRMEKSLSPAGIQTLDCPAHSLVSIMMRLFQIILCSQSLLYAPFRKDICVLYLWIPISITVGQTCLP